MAGELRRDLFQDMNMETKTETNPANKTVLRAPRVPMSTARRRLFAADIPGYRCYWFHADNVQHALAAYYEFVKPEEVHTNQLNVANPATQPGGTDLGSRVSLLADKHEDGQPARAYLMKIKLELFEEDQRAIAARNASVMKAIFGDEELGPVKVGEGGSITAADPNTYIDRKRTALFNRPVRKARPR
jgi:hypothetical protein